MSRLIVWSEEVSVQFTHRAKMAVKRALQAFKGKPTHQQMVDTVYAAAITDLLTLQEHDQEIAEYEGEAQLLSAIYDDFNLSQGTRVYPVCKPKEPHASPSDTHPDPYVAGLRNRDSDPEGAA